MPRQPRVDYPGAIHHVMNRGARRAAIFGEPWLAALFLEVLSELPDRLGITIFAYAVMPNHFHLLVRCPDAQLSRAMKHLGAEFTQRSNRAQAWDGHLFAYIHLNPVRAGLSRSADAATWTSHRALTGLARCPAWLHAPGLLASHGTLHAYREYVADSLAGVRPAPAGWDPDHLWVTASVAQPPASAAAVDVAGLLAEVAEVTGAPVAQLVAPGGRGNNARALAAWWLARRTRASNGEVGPGPVGSGRSRSSTPQLLHLRPSRSPKPWAFAITIVLTPPALGLRVPQAARGPRTHRAPGPLPERRAPAFLSRRRSRASHPG